MLTMLRPTFIVRIDSKGGFDLNFHHGEFLSFGAFAHSSQWCLVGYCCALAAMAVLEVLPVPILALTESGELVPLFVLAE